MNLSEPQKTTHRARAVLIVMCALIAHLHVWEDIFAIAMRDPEASHILLVPVAFLYLAWNRRDRLMNADLGGYAWGYAVILLSIVLHNYSVESEVIVGWHLAAILGLVGGLMAAIGKRVFTDFGPAILALLFLIPIPGLVRQQLSTPVQLACATIATRTLAPLGMDIGQHGCLLTVNGTDVAIAEACNGMRILYGVMLVVYTVAFTLPLRKRVRLLIFLLSPMISVGLNLLRLLATVAMFGLVDGPAAQAFHDINGWLIPVLIMAGAVLFMEKRQLRPTTVAAASGGVLRARVESPLLTGLAAVTLLAFPVLQVDAENSRERIAVHHRVITQSLSDVPFAIGDWLATESPLSVQELDLLKPLAAYRRTYRRLGRDDGQVTMVVIACSQARDLVGHEPGLCLARQGWRSVYGRSTGWLKPSRRIEGTDYLFENENWPQLRRRAASVLITYGRVTSGEPATVAAAAADFRRNSLGAVGIQLVCDDDLTDEQWRRITARFMVSFQPLVAQFRAFPEQFYATDHEQAHE
ncbi:MAG: exosortase-associated EpsI family protein [Planctomycetaceae bacterium]|nr:exosortase-associated EpsI family protein [Planctomycetaceae bacterium]